MYEATKTLVADVPVRGKTRRDHTRSETLQTDPYPQPPPGPYLDQSAL